MPPVLGPWSASRRRLWSCEVAKAKASGQKAVLFLVQRAGDLLFVAVPLE